MIIIFIVVRCSFIFIWRYCFCSALNNNNIKDDSRPLTAYYRTTQQHHQDIDGGEGHTGNTQPQPDLETLGGLTFDCFRRACVWLPLADVGRAMTVCKEWRSALDARDFWRSYLAFRYSFDLDEPPPTSPLALWMMSSLDSDDSSDVDERPQVYMHLFAWSLVIPGKILRMNQTGVYILYLIFHFFPISHTCYYTVCLHWVYQRD